MTDVETLDRARRLFVGETQGDRLAREVIAIAEQQAHTIACEVEHSRRMEALRSMIAPLMDAIMFARSQRRPMGIGQDFPQAAARVRLELGTVYGRERDNVGFWIGSDEVAPTDATSPSPCNRIALALIRLAHEVAEKVKPTK
jgi:hypothetical protein